MTGKHRKENGDGVGNIGKGICGVEDKKEGKGVNDTKHLLASSARMHIYVQFVSIKQKFI